MNNPIVAGVFIKEITTVLVPVVVVLGATSVIGSMISRSLRKRVRTLTVRMPSGARMRLEVDVRLSDEKVSDIVSAAVDAAVSGDRVAVEKAIEASREASAAVRKVELAD